MIRLGAFGDLGELASVLGGVKADEGQPVVQDEAVSLILDIGRYMADRGESFETATVDLETFGGGSARLISQEEGYFHELIAVSITWVSAATTYYPRLSISDELGGPAVPVCSITAASPGSTLPMPISGSSNTSRGPLPWLLPPGATLWASCANIQAGDTVHVSCYYRRWQSGLTPLR